MMPVGIVGSAHVSASSSLVCSFLQSASDATNLATYTFASQNIGTAASDRTILVLVHGRASGNRTISTVTIGGSAATVDVTTATGLLQLAVARLAVASGTSADIVVTFSGGAASCAIAVLAVTGGTLGVSDTDAPTPSAYNSASATVTAAAGGLVVAAANTYYYTGQTATFTNLTEDYDTFVETNAFAGGHDVVGSAGDVSPSVSWLTDAPIFVPIVAVAYESV